MEPLSRLADECRALLKTDWWKINPSSFKLYDSSEVSLPSLLREHWRVVLGATTAGALLVYAFSGPRNLPPGPLGLPIVGAMHRFNGIDGIQYDWERLGKIYGDVYSYYMGRSLIVVMNSHDTIKEAWVQSGEDYVHRLPMVTTDITQLYDEMFRAPYDEKWKINRKFTTTTIRAWGFSTQTGEGKILAEIDNIHRYLRSTGPIPMNPEDFSMKACANVTSDILFNKRYEFDDPDLQLFIDDIMRWVRKWWDVTYGETLLMWDVMPRWFMDLLYPGVPAYALWTTDVARSHVTRHVEEHLATFDPDNLRDVTDAFISDRGLDLDVRQLSDTLLAFVPDGVHTVSAMFKWAIMFVAKYPEVQKRAQKLIDEVIGESRKVMIKDRNKLGYVEAIGMEAVRISNPVPTSGARVPPQDTTFRGYHIPKGCLVYANYYAVHMDPELYPEPEEFKPERFLNDDETLRKSDAWIPFGMGRRMCPGEQLSKMQLFLLTANLLQRYNITFEGDTESVDIWAVEKGIIRRPRPFRLIMTER